MSMKKISLFLFALTIFFLVIPTAQAAVNYSSLKNEYIQNHPGQAILPFPWEPITSTQVLPFNYEIPAPPGNTLSMTACRNEFEPTSFIINAQKDLSGITITVPNLYDVQGNSIPSSALDVRLVKVWYQSNQNTIKYKSASYFLTPELLLKDDSLVKVDYGTRTNYLKATINGVEQYIDISSPTAKVPPTAQVRDATTLQPFSLKANENKQVWITVHVPSATPEGMYSGKITITAPSETPVIMNVSVTVLPFTLEPAPVEYGLYYQSDLYPNAIGFGTTDRNTANALAELQDMKDHGVLYPTLYQHNNVYIDQALTLRDSVGFPKDKIYTFGGGFSSIGNANDTAGLATVADNVDQMTRYTKAHGYTDTYFYGIDEAKGDSLLSQRAAWQTVHDNGGKIFAAGHDHELIKMVDILDTSVIAYELNTTQVALTHPYGHEIFSYANPQVGIENPEIYRNNYGLALWNAGYDGAMDFAYQKTFGDVWNDFEPGTYRDHVFAYPTSNGVIDTIQWEGWREGVDDTRYVASLIKKEGTITSAKTIVSAGLANNENMTAIRKKVINQILPTQVNRAPVLATADSYGTNEDTPLVVAAPGVLSNDNDVDGNPLKAIKVADPVHGIVVLNAKGDFTYTPTANYNGPDSFTYKANNGFQDSAAATVTLTVTPEASPASITVTAPNGGETWQQGSTKTITWSSTGSPGSTVKIVLLKAGTEVGIIKDNTSIGSGGKGSYSWPIASSGTWGTGSDYTVSVQSISQPTIKDTSNTVFTLTPATSPPATPPPAPSSITVTAPIGGETWQRGTSQTITWDYSGSPGSTVKIVLLKAGTELGNIKDNTSIGSGGKGSYTWQIASSGTWGTGSDYTVSVQSISQPTIKDTSTTVFTLTPATSPPATPPPAPSSITVTAPNGGEIWQRGTAHTVTWNYAGSPGSTVKIVLLKAGTEVGTIKDSTSLGSGGKGSFTWQINPSGTTGSDYTVSVQSISQPTIKDTSNTVFTLTPATSPPATSPSSITVTAPNGGETWQRGTAHTVTWDYSGSSGSTVKIVLLKAGTEVGTIKDSTSLGSGGKGSFTWQINPSGTTGSDYTVGVQSISQPTIKDTSTAYFTITAAPAVAATPLMR